MSRGGLAPVISRENIFEYCEAHRLGILGPPRAATIGAIVLLWPTTRTTSPLGRAITAARISATWVERLPVTATTIVFGLIASTRGAAVNLVRWNCVVMTVVTPASA